MSGPAVKEYSYGRDVRHAVSWSALLGCCCVQAALLGLLRLRPHAVVAMERAALLRLVQWAKLMQLAAGAACASLLFLRRCDKGLRIAASALTVLQFVETALVWRSRLFFRLKHILAAILRLNDVVIFAVALVCIQFFLNGVGGGTLVCAFFVIASCPVFVFFPPHTRTLDTQQALLGGAHDHIHQHHHHFVRSPKKLPLAARMDDAAPCPSDHDAATKVDLSTE